MLKHLTRGQLAQLQARAESSLDLMPRYRHERLQETTKYRQQDEKLKDPGLNNESLAPVLPTRLCRLPKHQDSKIPRGMPMTNTITPFGHSRIVISGTVKIFFMAEDKYYKEHLLAFTIFRRHFQAILSLTRSGSRIPPYSQGIINLAKTRPVFRLEEIAPRREMLSKQPDQVPSRLEGVPFFGLLRPRQCPLPAVQHHCSNDSFF